MEKQLIENYFEQHREEYLQDLAKLIAIDSRRGEARQGMPFGEGPARALKTALDIAAGYGLYTENWENYLGIVQINCEQNRNLDILTHLDVVPASPSDWRQTDPFVMKIDNGKVYGRGVADDKGPALAVIYSLRAIKELRLSLKGNPRVFLGCGEETGSEELHYYFERTEPAEMTISPDASFPVINIEKGILVAEIQSVYDRDGRLPRILSIKGGTAYNTVAETCKAIITGISAVEVQQQMENTEQKTRVRFTCIALDGGETEITAVGKAAHASMPEAGNNAIAAMLELLASLPFSKLKGFKQIQYLSRLFPHGDYYGRSARIYMEDEKSGVITVSPNLITYTETKLNLTIDARLPICFTDEKLKSFIEGVEMEGLHYSAQCVRPHYVDERAGFVEKLLHCYEEYTGEKGYCIAAGGLTYCHGIDNAVAFGFADERVDNFMHGSDEFAQIDRLLTGGKIYASAILKLCN